MTSRQSFALAATITAGTVVKVTAAKTVNVADTVLTDEPVGVLEQSGVLGDMRTVTLHGETWAIAGGVLTPGTHSWVTVNATGQVVAAAAGNGIVGRFLGDVAAVANQRVRIFVHPQQGL